ncbi:efflux RND transporter periplasmic adaptor subunit [uncultured Mucilaginibacter sp.]|uniref:efflux RND transporter periplasmic adaptor subunit n=1 Tax=uncultured Mucilaginibacter sp. TaxID=797541 RepID=UPI0025E47E1E|nr:efflux RND transporter periplasmic adaptor subunit [uncultured Mucilaginibacter sp.]
MKRIFLLSALIVLAACNNKPKDPKAELADLKKQQADLASKISALELKTGKTDSVKLTDVSTMPVKKGSFITYVELQGKIDAQDNVTAYPQAPGMITNLYVKTGDHVTKGEVLAQLDNSVLKQNIAQAESQATLANEVFTRQKNLWDQKIGTEIQFLQAQTNLQSAQKQVAALRQQADLYRITSPINGTIDQMDLKLGQAASPGATGIRIVNADNLKVKADVPESYSSKVNQGQDVKIVVPDANDSLTTKLTFAAKVIDPASRSFAIEIKLPTRKTLRPNMTVMIKIADYSKTNSIVVPLNAIQKSEQGDFVFVNDGGTAKRKAVTLGATYNSQTEILSGLNEGDQLITRGASDVEDGDKVKVSQ